MFVNTAFSNENNVLIKKFPSLPWIVFSLQTRRSYWELLHRLILRMTRVCARNVFHDIQTRGRGEGKGKGHAGISFSQFQALHKNTRSPMDVAYLTCRARLIPSGVFVSPRGTGRRFRPLVTASRVVFWSRSNSVLAFDSNIISPTWSKYWPTSIGGLTTLRRNVLISSRLSTPGGSNSRILPDTSTRRTMSNTQ